MHLVSHQIESTGSKWLQTAPNYSKWFQMAMASANGYGNGPTLSQIVSNSPELSTMSMIQHSPKWSNMVPKCLKWY